MPHYIFATYADIREEWAVQADSLERARELIGSAAAAGDWLLDAIHLDAEAVEAREFVLDFDDETPLIEEITPGHWAWREAHRDEIEPSLKQNIAAISGDFHTHRLCDAFYEAFGADRRLRRPVRALHRHGRGSHELGSRNGLSEAYENAGVPWIEVVEDFVETALETALDTGIVPDPAQICRRSRSSPAR
jgi:hypothetical protein